MEKYFEKHKPETIKEADEISAVHDPDEAQYSDIMSHKPEKPDKSGKVSDFMSTGAVLGELALLTGTLKLAVE